MNRPILLFSLLFSSFFAPFLCAQQLAGGEIYYDLISPNKYKVTAHIYRLCSEAALNSLPANVYGDIYKVPMTFNRISIGKINDTCNNPCNKQNAISNPGFEKHTFTSIVDFNVSPFDTFVKNNVCKVNFGVRLASRSNSLTTSKIGIFYLDASVNLCLPLITKNTSPQFSMEPKFRANFNKPFVYSPGPLDSTDNDSFVFTLVDAQNDYNSFVSHFGGSFTADTPMTPYCPLNNCNPLPNATPPRGFYFDKKNCTIIFTPSYRYEVGLIKYKVDEYRFNKKLQKHEWMGYVTREMLVEVKSQLYNNPPALVSTSTLNLCVGNKICSTIKTTDIKATGQIADDTTILFWDHGVKDAKFVIVNPTAREKAGEFCWTDSKKLERVETRFFTVATNDRQCNIDLTSKTVDVNVKIKPLYTYKNTLGKCGFVKWEVSAFDSLYPKFKASNTTVIRSLSTNGILYTGNGLIDSTIIYENGKAVIEHVLNDSCPIIVRDTVMINADIAMPNINDNADKIVCKNSLQPFSFKASAINGLSTFKWYSNGNLINQIDTIIKLNMSMNMKIRLRVENSKGCFAERNVNYNILEHKAIESNDTFACPGDLINVLADTKSLKQPLNFTWKINGIDTAEYTNTLSLKSRQSAEVVLILEDGNHCQFMDTVQVSRFPDAQYEFANSILTCRDSLTLVKINNLKVAQPFIVNWFLDNTMVSGKDTIFGFKPSKESKVKFVIQDFNTCSFSNEVTVEVLKTPVVKLPSGFSVCENSIVNIKPVISNRPAIVKWQWSINSNIVSTDSIYKGKIAKDVQLNLKVSNQLKCSTEDFITVNLYPKTELVINHNSSYLQDELVELSTTQTFRTWQWFNGVTFPLNQFRAKDLGPPGKYKVWCKVTDNYGCMYADTVEIITIANPNSGISKLTENVISIYPNPVTQDFFNIVLPKNAEIVLYSLDGKIILEAEAHVGKNIVSIQYFSAGMYLLKIKMEGEERVYRLVKE